MAKTKMTASIRNRLLSALVARAHDEKDREIALQTAAVEQQVYDAAVPPEVQELLRALPEDFRSRYSSAVRDPRGRIQRVATPGGLGSWTGTRLVSSELFDALCSAKDEARSSVPRRAETERKLSATLAGFRTVEDLLAAWPDVGPLLRPILEATAPAASTALVCAADLNKLCGLPVAEDAA